MEGAVSPPYEGQLCYGVSLKEKSMEELSEEHLNPEYLLKAYNDFCVNYPDKSFFGKADKKGHYWVDYLFGTDRVRIAIESGASAEEIKALYAEDVANFKEMRKPYLLYKDVE